MGSKFLTQNSLTALALLALVVVCILLLNWSFGDTMDGYKWQEELYYVEAGDTLWSISHEYCPEGVDRGEWIAEVQAINNLPNSNIRAGDDIIVLVAIGKE